MMKMNGSRAGYREVIVAEVINKRTYTVKEVGEILGVSRYAVYNLLKKEEFRYIKVNGGKYRISKKSFDDWLDKGPSL
jgi:excisionase family DNA binding protein